MRKGGVRNTAPAYPGFAWAMNAEDVMVGEAEVRSAYRMDQPHHLGGAHPCRRNCRPNPSCLAGLGERVWLEAEDEEDESDGGEEDELARAEATPAGLRNLGNTCYVNSFLQIWFHNPKFREALYLWQPGEDPVEQGNESVLVAPYEPRSKVASLQALFAMMQYTRRRFVDPADFITKLGLNPSVQQDAQEFSKLFISLLEDSLAHQSSVPVKTMIQKQFRGEYAYVTTCQACRRESVRPSHFYELDLALAGGNKTVADCLKDFLKVERMTGDEQYYCEGCQRKQDAERCCRLVELPPVLNLQLNRFQFDMTLGRKKKLNNNIQFPEELDMSVHLASGRPALYSLTGVLMHVGPDANHGHYIAHIQELGTGAWFKFSDETVAGLAGRTLRLAAEEEQGKKGKGKAGKGVQNSNNAYMLVYMLQDSIRSIRAAEQLEKVKRAALARAAAAVGEEPEVKRRKVEQETDYILYNGKVFPAILPEYLRSKVDKDNTEFEEERRERVASRREERVEARSKQRRMVREYRGLKWSSAEASLSMHYHRSYEFLPHAWLLRWLADPLTCGPIETRGLLCVHSNLDIDKLAEVKVCSADTVGQLYRQHGAGEGPRLTSQRLCRTCVKNKARTISLEYRMARDQAFLAACPLPCDGTGFWVGKKSYQQWRRHAKVALEDQIISEAGGRHSPGKNGLKLAEAGGGGQEGEETFCLTELQAKLQKMGTNVSLAQLDPSGKGGAGGLSGLSVIKNGEAFKMNSVAEMKMNLTEEEKKAWSKPVQAVRPMQKAPKPSATVKPFVKSEGITEMEEQAKVAEVGPGGETKLVVATNGAKEGVGETVVANGTAMVQEAGQVINGMVEVNGVKEEVKHLVREEGDYPLSPRPNLSSPPSTPLPSSTSLPSTSTLLPSSPSPSTSAPTFSSPSKPTAKVAPDQGAATVQESTTTPLVQEHVTDSFNSDIICAHGNLRIEQKFRQLISRPAWSKLRSYFKAPITFQFGSPVCAQCEQEVSAANLQKERWKEEAVAQKSRLPDLFSDRDRPKWSKKTTVKVFLLSTSFVAAWRAFIRGRLAGKPGFEEPITDIHNKVLLCEHGGLLHPPTIAWEVEANSSVVMVSEEEMAVVRAMFAVDVEIVVDRENLAGGPVLTASPPPCGLCVASRQEAEQEDRLRYKSSIVFVRRISPDEKVPEQDAHQDPEYCSSPVLGEAPPPSRRSHRRPKVRGEREFLVHSDMKLRDFKVKLMEAFKVAPYDQNLMVNGEYLTENHMSLGQLKVLPGSLIFLRADEPTHIAPYHPEDTSSRPEEQGFKGTGLLSN